MACIIITCINVIIDNKVYILSPNYQGTPFGSDYILMHIQKTTCLPVVKPLNIGRAVSLGKEEMYS